MSKLEQDCDKIRKLYDSCREYAREACIIWIPPDRVGEMKSRNTDLLIFVPAKEKGDVRKLPNN